MKNHVMSIVLVQSFMHSILASYVHFMVVLYITLAYDPYNILYGPYYMEHKANMTLFTSIVNNDVIYGPTKNSAYFESERDGEMYVRHLITVRFKLYSLGF